MGSGVTSPGELPLQRRTRIPVESTSCQDSPHAFSFFFFLGGGGGVGGARSTKSKTEPKLINLPVVPLKASGGLFANVKAFAMSAQVFHQSLEQPAASSSSPSASINRFHICAIIAIIVP